MNTFMTMFVFLGLCYAIIGVWSLAFAFMPSLGIAVAGMLICALGWKYSADHLQ